MISLRFLFEDETAMRLAKNLIKNNFEWKDLDSGEHAEKKDIIKNILSKHASVDDLRQLRGVGYGMTSNPLTTAQYEPDKRTMSFDSTIQKNKVGAIAAHELSHHLDRKDLAKEIATYKPGKVSMTKLMSDYYKSPSEFVARGGAGHVRNQDADYQYWPEGQPTLKKHVSDLRKISSRLSPDQRMVSHHNEPDEERNAFHLRRLTDDDHDEIIKGRRK